MGYDYDAAVLGGGIAGVTAARVAATLGARTALIEGRRLGGKNAWTGCVPIRSLFRAADIVHTARSGGPRGIRISEPEIEFDRLIANVLRIREQLHSDRNSPEALETAGITVIDGTGSFVDRHILRIDRSENNADRGSPSAPRELSARHIFIATGTLPAIPEIPGLESAVFRTTDSIFDIKSLPSSMAVVGAGSAGCELGQAFQRLGSKVTIIEAEATILRADDEELSSMLQELLEDEGVNFLLGADITKIVSTGTGSILEVEQGGAVLNISADEVLISTGVRPNVASLNLDVAGVHYSEGGIVTDDRGRTNVRHIYALGGVSGAAPQTHLAEHTARVAVLGALLKTSGHVDYESRAWTTFTDPELAHVGATEAQLKDSDSSYQVYRLPFAKIDRAVTDGYTDGMIKVLAKKGSGKILGANILGHGAGEQIALFVLAVQNGITLRQMADTVLPYPTYALGTRLTGQKWFAEHINNGFTRLVQKAFGL